MKGGFSKTSQDLFNKLLESFNTDLKRKKVIEYNGDMFHGNPKKYLSNDKPNPFQKNITAQEMWDKDINKIKLANLEGLKVLTIWDSEYRWGNKNKIIDKCLKFLHS